MAAGAPVDEWQAVRAGTASALAFATMLACCDANAFDLFAPGPKALQRPRKRSPEMEAYASALMDVLDRYQAERAAHENDSRASWWRPWSARGYGLRATGVSSMRLLAFHQDGSGDARFAIGDDSPGLSCVGAMAGRRLFSFAGRSALFKGQCIDRMIAFIPVRASDEVRLKDDIESGRRLVVTGVDQSGSFDLSGVPVLKAILAAEALGKPPDE